jgi:Tfp pilus assembly protein PilN
MRPVNLLPEQHRPHVAGGKSGSAYVVVGVLAALVVGIAVYVLTGNQANDSKAKAAEAKQDAQQAQARLDALGNYGSFSQVADTRKSSVEQLAQGRFDWERFLRETANVLPESTWLTTVDATTVNDGTAAATGDESKVPGAQMEGCAKRQSDVAKLMVRLRQLHRVSDVELQESGRTEPDVNAAGGNTLQAGADGCGPYYKFIVKAVFELAPEPVTPERGGKAVPAKLGGGS